MPGYVRTGRVISG